MPHLDGEARRLPSNGLLVAGGTETVSTLILYAVIFLQQTKMKIYLSCNWSAIV